MIPGTGITQEQLTFFQNVNSEKVVGSEYGKRSVLILYTGNQSDLDLLPNKI